MSFKDPNQPLRDILESVRMIEDFTAGMNFEQFREDPKTVAAVERKFLVIGEAAVRLGREAPLIVADVPWRQIRDLGNLLRHAHDKVDLEIIWQEDYGRSTPVESHCSKASQTPPGTDENESGYPKN